MTYGVAHDSRDSQVPMKTVDRRTFLKGAAALSAATAASVVVPDTVLPASDILRRTAGPGPVWKKTPCRLCGVGCGLLVGVENGRAVAVKGDPDSAVSEGLGVREGL